MFRKRVSQAFGALIMLTGVLTAGCTEYGEADMLKFGEKIVYDDSFFGKSSCIAKSSIDKTTVDVFCKVYIGAVFICYDRFIRLEGDDYARIVKRLGPGDSDDFICKEDLDAFFTPREK